jgi:Sulfotransferase family
MKAQTAEERVPQGVVTIPDHPLIYLNVPKAACTTIKNLLYFMQFGQYDAAPLDIHSSTELVRSRTNTPEVHATIRKHMGPGRFVFTFVREPGRRAYSCFVEKVLYQKHRSFPHVRSLLTRRYGFDLPSDPEEIGDLDADRVVGGFKSFLRFVRDNVNDRTHMKKDAHWMPQSFIVRNYLREFIPDLIGRVETFEQDFAYVLTHYRGAHIPSMETKFNEGPKPPHRFETVADYEVRGLLSDIYGADYHQFGYDDNA